MKIITVFTIEDLLLEGFTLQSAFVSMGGVQAIFKISVYKDGYKDGDCQFTCFMERQKVLLIRKMDSTITLPKFLKDVPEFGFYEQNGFGFIEFPLTIDNVKKLSEKYTEYFMRYELQPK